MTFKKKKIQALSIKANPSRVNPVAIMRNRRGQYVFLSEEPRESTHSFTWFMRRPRLVTLDEMRVEMQDPTRSWFSTDRFSHQLCTELGVAIAKNKDQRPQKKDRMKEGEDKEAAVERVDEVKEVTSLLEPYVCILFVDVDAEAEGAAAVKRGEAPPPEAEIKYWIGPRVLPRLPNEHFLVLTIAELYLKNAIHQRRMMQQLVYAVRRVLHNEDVLAVGHALIEVRSRMPSPDELHLLRLLPGLGKIYRTLPKELVPKELDMLGGYDPRGDVVGDGAGGMPIMSENRVLCLMSGGIDSPVAAYKMMVRGCHVDLVHFLNSTSEVAAVMDKNRRIAQRLSEIQGHITLRFVDIQKIQTQIVAKVPNQNRTLTYKFFMLALSVAAAQNDGSKLLVVGDSVGQVASQTVENISSLYRAVDLPVIAPLVGTNKVEIMECAHHIGTFDISTVQASDCCQYMMCKTGANLYIGPKTLRGCARAITLDVLPVRAETFRDGKLVKVVDEELQPIQQRFVEQGLIRAAVAQRQRKAAAAAAALGGDQIHQDPNAAGLPSTAAAVPRAPNGQSVAHEDDEDLGDKSSSEDEQDPATKIVNFDCAAGTEVHAKVHQAMLKAPHGNPSTLHASGRAARMAIEQARVDVATMLGVPATDIIFTSGGTESNRIALNGFRVVHREAWMHASTVGTDVDHETTDSSSSSSQQPTIAVIDLVNHETGSINSIKARPEGCQRLHVDACQAFLKIDFATFVDMSVVDSMALTAHKINGPIGCGILYLRNAKKAVDEGRITPLFVGGVQESKVRPGTENTPAIVGLHAALKLDRSRSVHQLIDDLVVSFLSEQLGCTVNRRGPCSGFICHATLPVGYNNVDVVTHLSAVHNVEIGTGSACKTGEVNNAGVYETLSISPIPEKRSIRISWDHFTTLNEATRGLQALQATLKKLTKGTK